MNNSLVHSNNKKQRHHRIRLHPMHSVTAAACLVLCLIASTAGATGAASESHPLTRGGGPCIKGEGSTSCSPKDELIHWTNDGKLSLWSETYSGGSAGYGQQIFQILGKIEKGSRLLDNLELEVRSDAGKDAIRQLFEELLSLASAHDDKWRELHQVDHFNKAVNAVETASSLYTSVWKIIEQGINSSIFSIYDRESVSSGISSAYARLFELYHQRCSEGGPSTPEYCTLAFKTILKANDWCDNSLMVLGIDVYGDRNVVEIPNVDPVAVENVKTAYASNSARFGAFLVESYSEGYVVDSEGTFRLRPNSFELFGGDEKKHLSEEQMKILTMSLVNLSVGQILYTDLAAGVANDLAKDEQRYVLMLASTTNYVGIVFSLLKEWTSAVPQMQMVVSLYEDILVSYKSRRDTESVEIATQMSEASEGLCGAYVNLPGKTAEAKKAFLEYIDTQRFVESQIPLHEPLFDEEDDEPYHEDGRLEYDGTTMSAQENEDDLQTYQTMLDEYLHQDIMLRVDYASYSHTDHAYEGGLRALIGAIYENQERNFEAVDELELAIELLRASDSDGDKRIQVELAIALMSLANANVGLRKWKSGYDAFEVAMDIFAQELGEGETPMNNACTGLSLDNRDCTDEVGEDTADDKEEEEEEESNVDISWGDYVKVENFEIVDDNNTTSTMVGASYSI